MWLIEELSVWRGWWMLRVCIWPYKYNTSNFNVYDPLSSNQLITTNHIARPTSVRGTRGSPASFLQPTPSNHHIGHSAHYAHTFYDFQLIAEWPRIEFAELKPKHKSPSVNDHHTVQSPSPLHPSAGPELCLAGSKRHRSHHHYMGLERRKGHWTEIDRRRRPRVLTTTTKKNKSSDPDVAALMDARIMRLIYSAHNINWIN